MLFDSHVHLDAEEYWNREAPQLARNAGVRGALNPAVDLASSERALQVHLNNPWVRPCFGIHPQFLGDLVAPPTEALAVFGTRSEYVAVGEVGLDFWEGHHDEERQRCFFETQARLAGRLGLPLILHLRKAFYEGLAVLRQVAFQGAFVVHGFTGSRDMARSVLDLGGYLGAGAALFRPSNENLRAIVRWAPRNRLLVETDAPPPVGLEKPGRQPWELGLVVAALAETLGIDAAKAAEFTWNNAVRLFGEPPA